MALVPISATPVFTDKKYVWKPVFFATIKRYEQNKHLYALIYYFFYLTKHM